MFFGLKDRPEKFAIQGGAVESRLEGTAVCGGPWSGEELNRRRFFSAALALPVAARKKPGPGQGPRFAKLHGASKQTAHPMHSVEDCNYGLTVKVLVIWLPLNAAVTVTDVVVATLLVANGMVGPSTDWFCPAL